jgi:sugar porter (SP) family MFS transporter
MDRTYLKEVEELDDAKVSGKYYIFAVVTALGGFLWGYDTGIIGPTLIYVTPLFHLIPTYVSLLVAGTSIFIAIGALAAGPIVDKFGRKKLLIIDGLIYGIFAFLTAISVDALQLIVWRSLIGLAIGFDVVVAGPYIAEFSPKDHRGRLVLIQQIMILTGIVIAFWIGYLLSFSENWRLMYGLGVIPAVILVLFRTYLPESPRWSLIHGKEEEAKKSLERFGIQMVGKEKIPQKEGGFRAMISQKPIRKSILIIGMWFLFATISGIDIILFYGPSIYKSLGIIGSTAILYGAISELIGYVSFMIPFTFIDKWGRRTLSLIGYGGTFFGMLLMIVGLNFYYGHSYLIIVIPLIFLAMNIYLFFYKVGVTGVMWALQSEGSPTEFRGKFAGIMMALNQVGNFFILFLFPIWSAAFGVFSFFVLEGVINFVAVILVFLFLPETKNISLDKASEAFS